MSFYSKSAFSGFQPAETKPTKRRTVTVHINGIDISVKIKPESTLVKQFQKQQGYSVVYDMYEAAEHMLSREDIINKYDPQRHSDWMPRPEVSEHATPLTEKEVESRLAFITDCYRLLNDDHVVEAIVTAAPKKKNGTLYKRKHTRIASAATVSKDSYVFEIEAYATNDTELEIRAEWIDFNDEEKEAVEKDLISTYPELLSGKVPTISSKQPSKSVKKPSYSTVFFEKTPLKVIIEKDDGVETLAGVPLSEFKCLKSLGKAEYQIDTTIPAIDKVSGDWIDDYLVCDEGNADLVLKFRNIFLSLCEENLFTPVDEQLIEYLNDIKEYFESSGERFSSDIKQWPKGLEKYKPKYSKEQSLAELLGFIDAICGFTDLDVQNALGRLERAKSSGKIKPNQKIEIYSTNFFVPARSNISEFYKIYSGTVPRVIVCSPCNPPKRKDICFR